MTAHKPGDPLTLNRLYGRSSGHKLRKGQQELLDSLLPQIEVPAEGEITAARLFGEDRPLHFEIGFGSGEHLADRADMLPDHGFIGAEPFLNGVATALGHIRDKHLANVRLWRGDALEVLRASPRRQRSASSICFTPIPGRRRGTPSGEWSTTARRAVRSEAEARRRVPSRD